MDKQMRTIVRRYSQNKVAVTVGSIVVLCLLYVVARPSTGGVLLATQDITISKEAQDIYKRGLAKQHVLVDDVKNEIERNQNSEWFRQYMIPFLFEPIAISHCTTIERIGAAGDGGKYVCDGFRLASSPSCVVYSFGSNEDTSFEEDIHSLHDHCEIHTFDPTVDQKSDAGKIPYINFHFDYGLGHLDGTITSRYSRRPGVVIPVRKLSTWMDKLGHNFIDILKIDIDLAEYEAFEEMLKDGLPVWQIVIEVHTQTQEMWPKALETYIDFFERMEHYGWVMFAKESNYRTCGGANEYAFINLNNPKYNYVEV